MTFVLVEAEGPKLRVEDVPVVREFSYVFLMELLEFPVEHKIEFAIEVQPGTDLISIPPYWMAPSELKKLETQLRELIDKGFVQLSISSWGAPILFLKNDSSLKMGIDYL